MSEIRESHDDELDGWVAVMRAAGDDTDLAEGYRDWKRQARHAVWLLATDAGAEVGAALGIGGWHEPPGVARGEIRVIDGRRGGGHGTALLQALSSWARDLGYRELMGPVDESDDASLAWAGRRGFTEVGRNSRLVLDLTATEAPEVPTPPGVEIVTWADRPDLAEGLYSVACEAYPDVPGEEDAELAGFEEWLSMDMQGAELAGFEEWLSMDMQGAGDRADATWVALVDGEVAAYAKLAFSRARPAVVMHDMTGVRRAFRGRGIAGALKATQIAWAKENGFERLETQNEERNEPIRRLNQRYGYVVTPGSITVRGPLAG